MEVYKIIKHIRTEHGYSQSDVAKKLGLTQSSYAKIENNNVEISLSRIQAIAEIYSLTAIELLAYNLPQSEEKTSKLNELEKLYKQIIKNNQDLIDELREKADLYKKLYTDLKKEKEKK